MRKDIHTYVTATYIALVGLIVLAVAVSPSRVVNFILFFSLLGLMGIKLIFEGIQGIKYKALVVKMVDNY